MCDMCKMQQNGATLEEAQARYLDGLRTNIELNGWALSGVEDAEPPFVYSVGRTQFGWPELIIFGNVSLSWMAAILHGVHRRGGDLTPGERLAGELEEDALELGVAEVESEFIDVHTPLIRKLFPDAEARLYQILWPDPDNHLPGDPGYDTRYHQPVHVIGGH